MEKCLWKIKGSDYSSLNEDKECDVLIVGGGITGVSIAYYLKNYSGSIMLIERGKLGNATTMKSSAKLTYLQQDIALKVEKCYGYEVSKNYVDAQVSAINEMVNIIKKEKIKCHLEKNISYLYIKDKENKKKFKKLFNLYKRFGYNPYYTKISDINCYLAFAVKNSYVFHPLLYMNGLLNSIKKSNNVSIYENTAMTTYKKINDKYEVSLNNGNKILCNHLVFANHYLPFITPYFLPFKNYLETSLVFAYKNENKFYNAINIDKNIESIRFFDNYKIIVSNSKKLSNKSILKNNNIQSEYTWHNYDLMTHNSLPLIGKIKQNENIYVATGYNTWGMTNSNIAARIIASYIKKEENELSETFNSFYPFSVISFVNGIVDNVVQISHLIASYFTKCKDVEIIWKDGKRYGVYTDEKGKKHTILITCPHMKCSLQFNKSTKRWECPCHGSEFDIDGKLLRGPSVKCIKPKK